MCDTEPNGRDKGRRVTITLSLGRKDLTDRRRGTYIMLFYKIIDLDVAFEDIHIILEKGRTRKR